MSYEAYQPSLHPTGLAGAWGGRWGAALGRAKDAAVPVAKDAVKARFLLLAPGDALPDLGRDRVIPRLPGEDTEGYRARLVAAWDSWGWATTDRGLRESIVLAGFGGPTLLTQRQFPRPPRPEWWSRFTVLFTGLVVWDGDAAWDDDAVTWDGRLVAPVELEGVPAVRRQLEVLLSGFKSARDRVTSVMLAYGAILWDVSGVAWDDGLSAWDEGGLPNDYSSEAYDDALVWDSIGVPGRGSYDYFL